jgi:hypothetical protein
MKLASLSIFSLFVSAISVDKKIAASSRRLKGKGKNGSGKSRKGAQDILSDGSARPNYSFSNVFWWKEWRQEQGKRAREKSKPTSQLSSVLSSQLC